MHHLWDIIARWPQNTLKLPQKVEDQLKPLLEWIADYGGQVVQGVLIPFRAPTLDERLRDVGLDRYFCGPPALQALGVPLLVAHLTGNA